MNFSLDNKESPSFKELIQSFPRIGQLPLLLTKEKSECLFFDISIYLENEYRSLSRLNSSNSSIKTSRKRIEAIKSSRLSQIKKQKELLAQSLVEFGDNHIPRSTFNPYDELFFRDWCWNKSENSIFIDYLKNKVSNNTAFLGCGAGKVAYEVAKHNPDLDIYATDLNPLNLLPILNSKSLKLYDTLYYSEDLKNVSQKYDFKAPVPLENLNYFVSDFYQLPFSNVECIVTNWLLDILPTNLDALISHISHHLSKSGTFHYIGLANFRNKTIESSYGHEEIIETFKLFFQDVSFELKRIDYLSGPGSASKREELVLFASCSNKTDIQTTALNDNQNDHLKFNQSLYHKKLEIETIYKVLKHIDRDISFDELYQIVKKEYNFSDEEARKYTPIILKKLSTE